MMISPITYYEEYLKGKNEKQLQTAIRKLKKEIKELKEIIEHPDYECTFHPSERVRISCNRDYLEEAKKALEEVGGTYKITKEEQKSIEFQNNIRNISKISFEIGSFFDGSTQYVLTVNDDKVHFTSSKFGEVLQEKEMDKDKEELICDIERLYIGEWLKYYDPVRFGYAVLDGTQWELEIEYNNGSKKFEVGGSNDYPYNFDDFKDIFELDEEFNDI